MDKPSDTPPSGTAPATETVPLSFPLHRGKQVIASVKVRKPKPGEMRGLNLQGIQQADVNTMLVLIPRITVPPLLAHEVENDLDAADMLNIAGAIAGFFYTPAEKAQIAKMLGQIEPGNSTN